MAAPSCVSACIVTATSTGFDRSILNVNDVVPKSPSSFVSPLTDTIALSSLRIVPSAVAWTRSAVLDWFVSSTVNVSSNSTVVSPCTGTLIVFDVSPTLNVSVPVGRTPPTKSSPSASPPACTAQSTVVPPAVSPDRVTVNVKLFVPESPSVLSASAAAISRSTSSLRIVPSAVAVSMSALEALLRVTVNTSSSSTSRSPSTGTSITCEPTPTPNVNVPDGSRTPPKSKSSASASSLVTAQFTVVGSSMSPLRVTVNVKLLAPV